MKKSLPILFGLFIILLFVVGTAAGSKQLTSSPDLEKKVEPVIVNQPASILEESKPLVSFSEKDDFTSIAALAQDEPELEAKLKVTKDDVFYCGECDTAETCEFEQVDKNKETLVEGDAIRTGATGTAAIKFSDEVDLVLAPNTQIRILKYQTAEDGTTQIHIEQSAGEVFFSVKYSKKESPLFDFRVLTPTAVIKQAANQGKLAFSGISSVQYGEFTGLSPQALANELQDTFSSQCGAICTEDGNGNILQLANLGYIDLTVDDLTGNLIVQYINEGGFQQSILYAGQTFRYTFDGLEDSNTWLTMCRVLQALMNDESPSNSDITEIQQRAKGSFTSITQTPNCGDGVCDVYDNENKKTCPQDCK